MRKRSIILSSMVVVALISFILILALQQHTVQLVDAKPYPPETARSNGDIILLSSGVENIDRLNTFIKNVKVNKEDKIRIAEYTTEGGAVIKELEYKNNKISYTYDNSRDGFAGEKDRGIETSTFNSIYSEKEGDYTNFYLKKMFKKLNILSIKN